MIRTTALAALSILGAAAVEGQWANRPVSGVPRTSAGAPDLQAAALRTQDGKPDLSGIWEGVKNRPCPPTGCPDQQLTNEFMNLGIGLPGGLPYQPWALDLMKQRRAQSGQRDPSSVCLPLGLVKIHTSPFPRKIVQTPGLLLILSERDTTFRQIFIDGRPLPDDPGPTWNGYSTARWQGDVLIVESNGFRDGTWLDRDGDPLTEGARITERFRRPSFGRMEIEMTVNDPNAYTKPWTVTMNFNIVLDTELLEYYCTDNDKNAAKISRE